MLKYVIFACLCVIVLVKGQDPKPPSPPSISESLLEVKHSRVARQSMPEMPSPMPSMQDGMGGNPGNLAMQGLGNIPDPTSVIAKAQEVGRQFMSGRRRRQAGPPPDAPSPPSTFASTKIMN